MFFSVQAITENYTESMDNQKQNKQYLTFRLAEEQYGLEVLQVREVLEIPSITRVPRMPEFLKGVINIRGSVLSVIDLRIKLGLPEAERTVHSRVVIVEIDYGDERLPIGILVDSVQEVVNLDLSDISPAPHIGTAVDSSFIDGIAKFDNSFIIIVSINRIFESKELASFNKSTSAIKSAALAQTDDSQETHQADSSSIKVNQIESTDP